MSVYFLEAVRVFCQKSKLRLVRALVLGLL
jgi:hypothetical protein